MVIRETPLEINIGFDFKAPLFFRRSGNAHQLPHLSPFSFLFPDSPPLSSSDHSAQHSYFQASSNLANQPRPAEPLRKNSKAPYPSYPAPSSINGGRRGSAGGANGSNSNSKGGWSANGYKLYA